MDQRALSVQDGEPTSFLQELGDPANSNYFDQQVHQTASSYTDRTVHRNPSELSVLSQPSSYGSTQCSSYGDKLYNTAPVYDTTQSVSWNTPPDPNFIRQTAGPSHNSNWDNAYCQSDQSRVPVFTSAQTHSNAVSTEPTHNRTYPSASYSIGVDAGNYLPQARPRAPGYGYPNIGKSHFDQTMHSTSYSYANTSGSWNTTNAPVNSDVMKQVHRLPPDNSSRINAYGEDLVKAIPCSSPKMNIPTVGNRSAQVSSDFGVVPYTSANAFPSYSAQEKEVTSNVDTSSSNINPSFQTNSNLQSNPDMVPSDATQPVQSVVREETDQKRKNEIQTHNTDTNVSSNSASAALQSQPNDHPSFSIDTSAAVTSTNIECSVQPSVSIGPCGPAVSQINSSQSSAAFTHQSTTNPVNSPVVLPDGKYSPTGYGIVRQPMGMTRPIPPSTNQMHQAPVPSGRSTLHYRQLPIQQPNVTYSSGLQSEFPGSTNQMSNGLQVPVTHPNYYPPNNVRPYVVYQQEPSFNRFPQPCQYQRFQVSSVAFY